MPGTKLFFKGTSFWRGRREPSSQVLPDVATRRSEGIIRKSIGGNTTEDS